MVAPPRPLYAPALRLDAVTLSALRLVSAEACRHVALVVRPDGALPAEHVLDSRPGLPADLAAVYADLTGASLSPVAAAAAADRLAAHALGVVPVVDAGRRDDDLLTIGSRTPRDTRLGVAVRLRGEPDAVPDAVARLLHTPALIARRPALLTAILRIQPVGADALAATGALLAHAPFDPFAAVVVIVEESPPTDRDVPADRLLPTFFDALLAEGRSRRPVVGDLGPITDGALGLTDGRRWTGAPHDDGPGALLGGPPAVAGATPPSRARSVLAAPEAHTPFDLLAALTAQHIDAAVHDISAALGRSAPFRNRD